jgi:hypothetical protein
MKLFLTIMALTWLYIWIGASLGVTFDGSF